MTKDQFSHAIRAACEVSSDNELWVFGSQSILGQKNPVPESLCSSIELDVQPKNLPGASDLIDGNLGELSLFHATHGCYVHGVSVDSICLPKGWENRTIPFYNTQTNGNTGWCLEVHDLAVSKLAAFRQKDKDFVLTMLIEKMISPDGINIRLLTANINKD